MKRDKNTILFLIFLTGIDVFLAGCGKQSVQFDQGWSASVKISDSKDSLIGDIMLQKWHDTLIVFQGLDPEIARDVSARCFLMDSGNDKRNSWTEVSLDGVPQGYVWAYPAIDQASDKVFFEQAYTENDQLVMKALVGRMAGRIAVTDAIERKWQTDKKNIFGETDPDAHLSTSEERDRLSGLGRCIMNDSNLYIPYCLDGRIVTFSGKSRTDEQGPVNNGVLHSSDYGLTWQMERISKSPAALPSVCRTTGYYYYFAVSLPTGPDHIWDLWCSHKSMDGNSWDATKAVTKTFGHSALQWKYVAISEADTVHVCWLDSRHEKRRFNLVYPFRENYEVVYCRRKDSDSNWSEDVILSKGLLYSYSPSMSVEGDDVVVAWAGVPTASDGHSENSPNDIFYRTSKDGGKTWGKLFKVTDSAKDGTTSGEAQVALQNGIIHLFYIQGKLNLKEESPGLTKLNQPPWPIYYTQRPFPK